MGRRERYIPPAFRIMTTKHTPGPWTVPHFADPDCKCKCAYVLCEKYAGSICEIDIGNEKPISEGGNDAPPLEEAKANAYLIAHAPDMLATLRAISETIGKHGEWDDGCFYYGGVYDVELGQVMKLIDTTISKAEAGK